MPKTNTIADVDQLQTDVDQLQTDVSDNTNAINNINSVPSGGTTGYVLTKTSSGYNWQQPSTGTFVTANSTLSDGGNWSNYKLAYQAPANGLWSIRYVNINQSRGSAMQYYMWRNGSSAGQQLLFNFPTGSGNLNLSHVQVYMNSGDQIRVIDNGGQYPGTLTLTTYAYFKYF